MLQRPNTPWWPALDGLRGVAVAAVVAYHLDESLVPGGFLGVSLFFSISGFLIVGQLAAEHEATGRVDLPSFWARRVRRLAPAFVMTVLATIVVVAIREQDALERVVGDALAGIFYVANWRDMATDVTYADRFGVGVDPLGHLWSLSIEEQIYLVAPIVVGLWGIRRAGMLGGALAGVGIALWWGSTDAYFSTLVRFAEVFVGGVLGVYVLRGGSVPRWLSRLAWPASLLALLAFATVSDVDQNLFRLGLPLLSLAWVAVIAGSVTDGSFARVTANPLLRWVGGRSYAIYLFHVPVIELTDWSWPMVVAITLLAAEVSHRLVEWPVRKGAVPVPRLLGAAGVVAVVAVGSLLVVERGDPEVDLAVAEAVADARSESDPGLAVPPAVSPVESSVPSTTTLPAPMPPGTRVLTVGDSTMEAIEPAMAAYLDLQEGELVAKGLAICSPLFTGDGQWSLRFNPVEDEVIPPQTCRTSMAVAVAEDGPVDVVVMIDHGTSLMDHRRTGSQEWLSIADEEVADAIRQHYSQWAGEAREAGVSLVLATAAPTVAGSPASAFNGDNEDDRVAAYNELVRNLAEQFPDTVQLVDLGAAIEADPDRYQREDDGVHLSESQGAVAAVVDHLGPTVQLASARP